MVTSKSAAQWNSRLKSNEHTQIRMTFGKHKGKLITEVPTQYLEWLLLNCDDYTAEWFRKEYIRRHKHLK